MPVLRECLVPFWSKSDLNEIGAHHRWTKSEIDQRYYYSGGNLRDFLLGADYSGVAINQAICDSSSDTDPKRKYWDCGEWICVITSEYELRELGTIVKPSYYMYEELWSKGHMLGGRRVDGIAFKNYVHTMARDGEEIELQLRPYNRSKTDQHTYAAVKLKASKLRNDGRNAAECEQNAAGLVQIRKSPTHKTDLNVLDEYAGLFPQGTAKYIVMDE
ncbi:hypothetical protein GQ600_10204 [Phytophthora cactorum]|nr:hypothetical protein GQ600_10204 [Phytophthora cactorum]